MSRWTFVGWLVVALAVGAILGSALGHVGETCSTETEDGGLTVTETCTRDVAP